MTTLTKRGQDLSEDLAILLAELCQYGGYCNDLSADDLMRDREVLNADTFAVMVLKAEGLNPDYELKQRRSLKSEFYQRYGSDKISESEYTLYKRP